jgi:TctA family transporter
LRRKSAEIAPGFLRVTIMGQIVGVIGTGILFLSFCAYCEARDVLQSSSYQLSPRRAKIAGLFAASLTIVAGVVICCALVRGAPFDGSF